jgi:regulator of protease activity HflC (stomatin/prohibitin superfamily)
LVLSGLTPFAPGEARVVQLFGRYAGTIRTSGLRWVNPFARRRRVSVRIRTQETAIAKVNDADGIPIEIAAIVSARLSAEITARVATAGVGVIESRITRLS